MPQTLDDFTQLVRKAEQTHERRTAVRASRTNGMNPDVKEFIIGGGFKQAADSIGDRSLGMLQDLSPDV